MYDFELISMEYDVTLIKKLTCIIYESGLISMEYDI